jgi:hypothetical protein
MTSTTSSQAHANDEVGGTAPAAGSTGAWKANSAPEALAARHVCTVIAALPVPGGLVAVIWVPETIVTAVAGAPPIVTVAGRSNPVPVMVTLVPPAIGPVLGETWVTVGVLPMHS